jgi:hypothetical protein
VWKNATGFDSRLDLHVFLIAQAFRMLYNPEHASASVAISRLLGGSAYGTRLQALQTMACMYSNGDAVAAKPAPLCKMCRAVFPKVKTLPRNAAKDKEAYEFLDKLTGPMAAALMVKPDSTLVGGEYTCVGEMPQCANLHGGCKDDPSSTCPFVR